MGSSAQSSSGMLWCRLRIRLNEVPEKIPKVPGGFGAEPGQVQQGSGEGSGEGQGFGEYTGGSGEGLGGFGAEPDQVQQGEEGSEEGLGAKPGQVLQGSQEGSGEGSAEPGQV